MQTDGLSHADSLLQPQPRGNCMNWVLGHLAVSRDRVMKALGLELQLSDEVRERYETGSEPVLGEEDGILRMAELLEILANGQGLIAEKLGKMNEEELAQEIEVDGRTMTIGDRVFGLYFHDTYHTAQTDYLRQLAGTNDKVI